MKSLSALICGLAGLASASFLPGLPTVPFEKEDQSFSLRSLRHIVVDSRYASSVDETGETLIPPTLSEFASVFAKDLKTTFGIAADTKLGAGPAAPDSIFLTLDPEGEYLDATGKQSGEAYTLTTGASGITITGSSPLGVWWGSRTVLQQALLAQETGGLPAVPCGKGLDIPGWSTRGMMLDAGRHYYPPDFVVELCAYMSFFKQNTLHMHLSDNLWHNPNYTTQQSNDLYARFRLYSDAPAVAGLNRFANESYDRTTWDAMQTQCAARGVVLYPEIEMPGHALAFTHWKPELALAGDASLLNISHPETIPAMQTVWDEFLPWFHTKSVSIGADEYTGPEADYNTFVNAMDGYIGTVSEKYIRIWGTFPPIYNATWTNVYQNVTVQHWANWADKPYPDYIKNNYTMINSADDFYVVNKWGRIPDSYPAKVNITRTFIGSPGGGFWRPYIFDQSNSSNNPLANSPFVLGSIVPLWNDYGANASVYSEAYYAWRDGIPALGDKQWGGNVTEAAFADIFAALQPHAPGQNLERKIPSKTDTIIDYKVTGGRWPFGGLRDASPNHYQPSTDCAIVRDGKRAAVAVRDGCSVTSPLDSKGRNYTLALSLRVDALVDPTNATLLTGRDSALLLTPNVTLVSGGNYYRSNTTVPQGAWFDLSIIGRGNHTYLAVDNGPEQEFLTSMGINGVYHYWAEIAIEAPLKTLGGSGSKWSGLFGGLSLKATA
ncbi:glycoside hydrolase [Ophiostoma piceae UAMH 11346]|uniref:beta-N-acetylhexosaminidase n=1 Tax=Ophiostoma piceae (strain UAMH 11346) TaxID=1262450 RepID=S3C465_OPHP1|nr:glycoside hydrolase [Ophiostoma piceae UAMH 11346]